MTHREPLPDSHDQRLIHKTHRTIQPDIPGATPLNLTGTVQEVWAQINTTWPGYQLPRK